MMKRLEAWAADSPERSRFLILALILFFATVVLIAVGVMAWVMLRDIDPT